MSWELHTGRLDQWETGGSRLGDRAGTGRRAWTSTLGPGPLGAALGAARRRRSSTRRQDRSSVQSWVGTRRRTRSGARRSARCTARSRARAPSDELGLLRGASGSHWEPALGTVLGWARRSGGWAGPALGEALGMSWVLRSELARLSSATDSASWEEALGEPLGDRPRTRRGEARDQHWGEELGIARWLGEHWAPHSGLLGEEQAGSSLGEELGLG
jgi:hypothetical protein